MNTVDKILPIANNEVGYLEKSRSAFLANPSVIWFKEDGAGYDNITKYAYELDRIDWYNGAKQGYAWCCCFVDWVFVKAFGIGVAKRIKNHGIYDASCYWAAESYKDIGQFFTEPEIGDQIFFSDSDGDPCHTGIVIHLDDFYVHTIEGNTSAAAGVIPNGGGVFRKKYSRHYNRIYGFGRPLYERDESMTKDEILSTIGDKWIAKIQDLQKYADWAIPYVRYMLDNGIINGGTSYETDPDDVNMFFSDIKTLICVMRLDGINLG